MEAKKAELSPKQMRFVAEYVVDNNATQAAIRAGYSKKTARVKASQLLAKVNIQDAVEAARAKLQEQAGIDAAWVVEQIATIAKDDGQRTQDRLKALEMLCKHLGLFDRKEEVDTEIRVVLGEAEEWMV